MSEVTTKRKEKVPEDSGFYSETKTVEINVSSSSPVMYDGNFPDVIWVPMAKHEAEEFLSELHYHPVFLHDTEKEQYSGILRWIGDRVFNLLQQSGSYYDRSKDVNNG